MSYTIYWYHKTGLAHLRTVYLAMPPPHKCSDAEHALLRQYMPRYINLQTAHEREDFWVNIFGDFFAKFPIRPYLIEQGQLDADVIEQGPLDQDLVRRGPPDKVPQTVEEKDAITGAGLVKQKAVSSKHHILGLFSHVLRLSISKLGSKTNENRKNQVDPC